MYKICTLWCGVWTLLAVAVSAGISSASAVTVASDPSSSLQRQLANPAPACVISAVDDDHPVARTVAGLYADNDFRPLWLDSQRYESLILAIDGLVEDGLDPLDYGVMQLRELRDIAVTDHDALVCRELQASYGYLNALYHLSHGKLNAEALEPLWRAPRADGALTEVAPLVGLEHQAQLDTLAQLESLAASGLADIGVAFQRARPGLARYHQLRQAYGQWRDQYRFVGWPQVPPGPILRPGMEDSRTPLVRQRLEAEGYLSPAGGEMAGREMAAPEVAAPEVASPEVASAEQYDETLSAAVREFQRRHRLKTDGIVGPQTRQEMNLSRAFRYDQIRANLERLRWLWREIEFNTVLVDIAGAEVIYLRDYAPLWRSRVQVGTSARPTPVLKSRITHLTFNPTWTVPPTIYRKDKLPEIRRDIGYLAKNRIRVLGPDGRQLDPYAINWNNPGAIRLRQDAGPNNALGLVAIRFPNPFAVYLHDTPNRKLFANEQRTTSSGCVRVEGAMDLSSILFEGVSEDKRLQIEAIKASGRTRNVNLPTPVPIVLAYWTVDVDEDGELEFRPDIYSRDDALVNALRAGGN